MKEFFANIENLCKKVYHGLKVFRPAGMEITFKKVAKIIAIVGAFWLLTKALGNFLLVWRVCRSVEVIASLFAH